MFWEADEKDIAYLAGIIDADGSIFVGETNGWYSIHLVISTTTPELLDWIEEKFSPPCTRLSLSRDRMERYVKDVKRQERMDITQQRYLHGLLKEILPYLVIKKEQAKLAIKVLEALMYRDSREYTDELREKLEKYRQRMKELNK